MDNPEHRHIVEQGGGSYVPGMFCGQVLFNSLRTGNTLSLPENDLTPAIVKATIALSDDKFFAEGV